MREQDLEKSEAVNHLIREDELIFPPNVFGRYTNGVFAQI